ncbi:unnamed protein product [Brachionus calyciflorus]|uniref:Hexosyltransferase n=1 Tax=Brachionus calyciflorus TaxID=104777 RepID=A0A814IEL0_9BILA|nr:unnamed protein product [Brachionus calyciflorus]
MTSNMFRSKKFRFFQKSNLKHFLFVIIGIIIGLSFDIFYTTLILNRNYNSRKSGEINTQSEIKRHEKDLNDIEIIEINNSEFKSLTKERINQFTSKDPNWKYFNESHIFFENTKSILNELSNSSKKEILDLKNHLLKRLNGKYSLKKLVNGYRKKDPLYGTHYLLDFEVLDKMSRETFQQRFELFLRFNSIEITDYKTSSFSTHLNLLICFTKLNTFEDIEKYELSLSKIINLKEISITIQICYLIQGKENENNFKLIESKFKNLTKINKILLNDSKYFYSDYYRQIICLESVLNEINHESIIVLIPNRLILNENFFEKVFVNTLEDERVYFPISLNLYNPDLIEKIHGSKKLVVNDFHGYFNEYSYEICSFFSKDYIQLRKKFNQSILTQRKNLYELFMDHTNLFVMRSIEHNILSNWTPFIDCEKRIFSPNENKNCLKQREFGFGDISDLFKYFSRFN